MSKKKKRLKDLLKEEKVFSSIEDFNNYYGINREERDEKIESFLAKYNIIDKDKLLEEEIKKEKNRSTKKRKEKEQIELNIDTLNIRGLTEEDAIIEIRNFLNKSLASNKRQVLIIHGKGERSKIWQGSQSIFKGAFLKDLLYFIIEKEYKDVIEYYYHPEEKYGGEGATLIFFR